MFEPDNIQQDADHIRLLAIFHFVIAGLVALAACIPLLHLVLGIVILVAPESFGSGNDGVPRAVGLVFVLVAIVISFAGWTFAGCLACSGRCLLRHKSYTFCLVMAAVACLMVPLGTILGVLTILVLLRPTTKTLFGQSAPA
jgi:hypothetical protein